MLRLRPFKISDTEYLLEWVKEERVFTMWCANKFTYPLTKEQLLEYKENYDREDNGWSFTALDETGIPVGHLMMRSADYKKQTIHFGFIIVNPKIRGKGYGKEMVGLAVKYAFEILKVRKATLAVFANNSAAHGCYKAVGFTDVTFRENSFDYKDEKWSLYDMQIEAESTD